MSQPFIGEIRMFAFDFPPRGWSYCNGSLLAIAQNQALFSILGTTYGGNGQTTFALPNLQGRVPVGPGFEIQLGQLGGETAHTLTASEMPAHTHALSASGGAPGSGDPSLNYLSNQSSASTFTSAASDGGMASNAAGGSQPHENMQPYAVTNFSIALLGLFPSRN